MKVRLGREPESLGLVPEKPRGMHWRTYERLRRRAKRARAKALADLMDLDLTDAFRARSAEDCSGSTRSVGVHAERSQMAPQV